MSKTKYVSLRIPRKYRGVTHEKVQSYRLGTEAENISGFYFSFPIKMIKAPASERTRADLICDHLIVREDYKFTLKKGKTELQVAQSEFKGVLEDAIATIIAGVDSTSPAGLKTAALTQEKPAKSTNYLHIYVPIELRGKEYESVQSYKLGAEYGNLAGYFFSNPKKMIDYDVAPNDGGDKVTLYDKVVCRKNGTFTLKNGDNVVSITADELKSVLANKALTDGADAREDLALSNIDELTARALSGSLEEDFYSDPEIGGEILFNTANGKYQVIRENGTLTAELLSLDSETNKVKWTEQGKQRLAQLIASGKAVFFDSLDEAKTELYGGFEPLPKTISETDAREIDRLYAEYIRDYTPSKDEWAVSKSEFAEKYIRERAWAPYKNFVNDKAYEKATPYSLREKPIFVGWQFQYYDKDGKELKKPTKVPCNPLTGGRAMSNAPSTWSNFKTACAAVDKYGFDGIGIMFGKNKLVGIDIDHCIDSEGKVSELARDIINTLDSYTELSPSGNGIHILAYGEIPASKHLSTIEIYNSGRFLTLTGHQYEGKLRTMKSAESTQPGLDSVWKTYVEPYLGNYADRTASGENLALPIVEQTVEDDVIMKNIERSPKMKGKFERLAQGLPPYIWDEENKVYTDKIYDFWYREDGSIDASRIDSAFARVLTYYNATPEQIDRFYKSMPLAREKWDEKRGALTYGQRVILNAMQNTTQHFDLKYSKQKVGLSKNSLTALCGAMPSQTAISTAKRNGFFAEQAYP